MVGAWFPGRKQEKETKCRLFLLGRKRKSLERKKPCHSLLPRTGLETSLEKGRMPANKLAAGILIGFSSIHLLVPRPPLVFPPVDSRRRNPEAENSPRFRGRIPRPASRGLRGATRLIGSNDGAGSRPRTGTLTFPTRSGVIARNQIAAANRCAVYNK